MACQPEEVWRRLVDADSWPRWYSNARRVQVAEGGSLKLGKNFTWITFGLPIDSIVTHCQEPQSLGWCWKSRGWAGAAWGYHGWRLEPDEAGTRVITEEAQRGLLPWALQPLLRPTLHAGHHLWLRDLAQQTATRP